MSSETRSGVDRPACCSSIGTGSDGHRRVPVALQEAVVCLRVLSDESLWLRVHGRWSSGETRRLHKDTVARRAAEVHSALDSPVVLPYRMMKQNPVSRIAEKFFDIHMWILIYIYIYGSLTAQMC